MAKKSKFYVVWRGVRPGIYDSWTDCQLQIKGFTGALYKSYPNKAEAQAAFQMGPSALKSETKVTVSYPKNVLQEALSVDAACAGNPGKMEYRGVLVGTKQEVFKQGPFDKGTNNIGEFLAIVHGLALLKSKKLDKFPIYTDSRTAMSWVKKKECRTNLVFDSSNADLLKLVKRAEDWLKNNSYRNPILKWETKEWGEIPADFGRK